MMNRKNNPVTGIQRNNPMQMIQAFNTFKQQMAGKNPEQIVKGLVASGRMSQEELNNYIQMAKQFSRFLK